MTHKNEEAQKKRKKKQDSKKEKLPPQCCLKAIDLDLLTDLIGRHGC